MSDIRNRQITLAKQFIVEDRQFREKWEEMFVPYNLEEREDILEIISVFMYDDNEKSRVHEEIAMSDDVVEQQALRDYLDVMDDLVEKWSEELGLDKEENEV